MKETSDRGLLFKAGAFRFNDAILITISDASWANDTKIVVKDGEEKIFPKRSQYGRIHLLGEASFWDGDKGTVHFIGSRVV